MHISKKWQRKITRFIKNLEQKYFYHMLNKAKCLIGNTSSGLREGCYIGLTNICVGTRQNGREIGKNTTRINNEYKIIYKTLKRILNSKIKNKIDYKYGFGNSGKKIVKILEKIKVNSQKKLAY